MKKGATFAHAVTGAWLVPLTLLATLLQSYYDLDVLFSTGTIALDVYEGPVLYKAGKDLVYVTLVLAIVVHAFRIGHSPLKRHSLQIVCVIAALCMISAAANGLTYAMLGLRWSLPFVIFLILGDWAADFALDRGARWLLLGLAACLGAQIFELFNMPPIFGEVVEGLAARTPGIFIAPNSAAFFGCAGAACVLVFWADKPRVCWFAAALAAAISLLAQSGTGIVVAAVLLSWVAFRRRPVVFVIVAVGVAVILLLGAEGLTRREDYLELSGGGRLGMLWSIAQRGAWSLAGFGVYTNAANLLVGSQGELVIPDSLVASWLGNFGIAGLPMAVLVVLFIKRQGHRVDWVRAVPCVIVFALFSATTIVFEAFPMNIYLAVGVWAARRDASEHDRLQTGQGRPGAGVDDEVAGGVT